MTPSIVYITLLFVSMACALYWFNPRTNTATAWPYITAMGMYAALFVVVLLGQEDIQMLSSRLDWYEGMVVLPGDLTWRDFYLECDLVP